MLNYLYKYIIFFYRQIATLVELFLAENICHNVMITRGTSNQEDYDAIRVFIWAREPSFGKKLALHIIFPHFYHPFCSDVTEVGDYSVAAFELAGHIPIYCEFQYAVFFIF